MTARMETRGTAYEYEDIYDAKAALEGFSGSVTAKEIPIALY